MKRIILVAQEKGGAGKSVLTYLLSLMHPEAAILDMDDATKTSMQQLAYRNPYLISFLSSGKNIDRSKFNTFLEHIGLEGKRKLYIADMGASLSEQFPYYLQGMDNMLEEIVTEFKITLDLYVVIGGANIFVQSMNYLDKLTQSIKGGVSVTVCKNTFYEFSPEQENELAAYAEKHGLKCVSFTLSTDKSDGTQERLLELLKSGQKYEQASFVTRGYFKRAVNSLQAQL